MCGPPGPTSALAVIGVRRPAGSGVQGRRVARGLRSTAGAVPGASAPDGCLRSVLLAQRLARLERYHARDLVTAGTAR